MWLCARPDLASPLPRRAVVVLARRPPGARLRQHRCATAGAAARDARTPADLGAWLAAAGLLDRPPARRRSRVLDEARDLRAAIDAVVTALVAGRAASRRDAVTRIDDWLVHRGQPPAAARSAPTACPSSASAPPADSPRRALGTIALDAADAARHAGRARARAHLRLGRPAARASSTARRPACGAGAPCARAATQAKARRHRERRARADDDRPDRGRQRRHVALPLGRPGRRRRSAPAPSPRCAWASRRSSPALRDEYDLTLGQVGLALSAVAVGVMVTLIPWGILTDRVGERPVLGIGLIGTAVALVAAAFAPSFPALLGGLLAAGMLGSSATGASGRAVMGWFGARRARAGARHPPDGAAAGRRRRVADAAVAGRRGRRARRRCWHSPGWRSRPRSPRSCGCATPRRRRPGRRCPTAPAPTRDPRAWRLGAASGLLVIGQSALAGLRRALPASTSAGSATAWRRPRWPSCSSAARWRAWPPGGARTCEGLRIPLLRRIAVADAVLLGGVALLATGARRAPLPGARPGRRHRDVLERPGLHRGRRDRRPARGPARR